MINNRRASHTHSILLFFLVFGLVVLGVYFYSSDTSIIQQNTQKPVQSLQATALSDFSLYETLVKNALIVVPDTKTQISLVDGRASYGTNLDGGDVTLIKLIGGFESQGTSYVFADLAVQSGGTGVFHYLVLFDITKGKATYRSSYFVGDRVVLVRATALPSVLRAYSVTLEYLDRAEGDAMVDEPTIQKTISIPVKDMVFVQSDL